MTSLDGRAAWQLPLQWPDAAAASGSSHSRVAERLLKAAILFAMLALTVLDRFGLRVTENYSLPAQTIALYAVLAAMIASGAAQLNLPGAVAYVAIATAAGASLMVNTALGLAGSVSMTSFLLLMMLYAPFAVSVRRGAVSGELSTWVLRMYVAFSLFIAVAGIAQYFAQFTFRQEWLFDFSPMIPEPIRGSGHWNTVILADESRPAWEAAWVKSNGFFLREPSIFSVAMAFALLGELSLNRRKWVMAVFGLALLVTYSGSGLLCLAVGMFFPLGRSTFIRVLACTLLGAAVFLLFGDALHLSYTLNRINEFNSQASSAYCRFIYGGVAAFGHMDSSPWAALLGHGPGSTSRIEDATCGGGATTYAKVLFEYGLVGCLALGALLVGALRRSVVPLRVRMAAAAAWLLLGGNLLGSEDLLFIYIIAAIWPEGVDPAARPRASDAI